MHSRTPNRTLKSLQSYYTTRLSHPQADHNLGIFSHRVRPKEPNTGWNESGKLRRYSLCSSPLVEQMDTPRFAASHNLPTLAFYVTCEDCWLERANQNNRCLLSVHVSAAIAIGTSSA